MQKFIQYLKDVRSEMAKVSWPTRDEVVGATTLVVILSIAFSIVIKVFDMALSRVLGFLLNL
ncbi:MAG: preprotein translocase subunit SecE [Chitinivibrionales bacterium]|nr:preprotein translocase subunit SecE [Chitinivibrionales bacterium]MBD3396195.1 preprotein translocase subunit SecE [Chitinivibrionales bacterium]